MTWDYDVTLTDNNNDRPLENSGIYVVKMCLSELLLELISSYEKCESIAVRGEGCRNNVE